MGKTTFAHIEDFLAGPTSEINTGDLLLKEMLGSVGTTHASVISPLLFKMMGVGKRLSRVAGVRDTIYADDIPL